MVKPKFESVKIEGDEKVSSGEETGQVEDAEDFIPLEDEAVMLIGGKKQSFQCLDIGSIHDIGTKFSCYFCSKLVLGSLLKNKFTLAAENLPDGFYVILKRSILR